MLNEDFVITKCIRFRQSDLDKYNLSGIGDFSKFVRKTIDAYDVSFESMKEQAKAEAYNECITKLTIERDYVIQTLQTPTAPVKQTLQNNTESSQNVIQTLQNTTENTQNVIQNNNDENPVLQKDLQNDGENKEFVLQMELSPYYEQMKPYLQLLSRQLNIVKEVSDDTKKKISNETGIPKQKVNTFIYEFRNDIMVTDYEIPDENDRVVEKHYNKVAGKFL